MGGDWPWSLLVALETCGCSLLCAFGATAWSPAFLCHLPFRQWHGLNSVVQLSKRVNTGSSICVLKKQSIPADDYLWIWNPSATFLSSFFLSYFWAFLELQLVRIIFSMAPYLHTENSSIEYSIFFLPLMHPVSLLTINWIVLFSWTGPLYLPLFLPCMSFPVALKLHCLWTLGNQKSAGIGARWLSLVSAFSNGGSTPWLAKLLRSWNAPRLFNTVPGVGATVNFGICWFTNSNLYIHCYITSLFSLLCSRE